MSICREVYLSLTHEDNMLFDIFKEIQQVKKVKMKDVFWCSKRWDSMTAK